MALLTVVAIAAVAASVLSDNEADPSKCDALLRKQLVNSPQVSANTANANATVSAIQDQRTNECRKDAWNPVVTSIARHRGGNIEVEFSTTGGISRNAAITTPEINAARWLYVATENQWYTSENLPTQFVESKPVSTPAPLTPSPWPPDVTTEPPHAPTTQQPPMQPAHQRPTPTSPSLPKEQRPNSLEITSDDNFVGNAAREFDRGRELLQQKDYQAALEAFQSAQAHHRKHSSVLEHQIGITYQELGNHQQAVGSFSNAIEMRDNPRDRTKRALSYIETGQCQLALQDANQVLTMELDATAGFHSGAEAHAALSTCHLENGDNVRAIEHAEQALSLMEQSSYPAEQLAAAYASAGDAYIPEKRYAKAIRHYTRAIELNDNAVARASRARVHRLRQNCNDALADAEEALKLTPTTKNGYHSSAEASWVFVVCLNETDPRSTQHIQTALQLMGESGYPKQEISRYHIWGGSAFFNHGRYQDAIRHYSQSIDLEDSAQARVNRAVSYWKTQNCKKAKEDIHRVLGLPSETWTHFRSGTHINSWAEAHKVMSRCLFDEGRWQGALQHAELAIGLMREHDYDTESIQRIQTVTKTLKEAVDPSDGSLRAGYRSAGERLNATRSPQLVWEDGSNWTDGVSHMFPDLPIVDQTPLKHHLTCAQREALEMAARTEGKAFSTVVWGPFPLAQEWNERNSFAQDCGSGMRVK